LLTFGYSTLLIAVAAAVAVRAVATIAAVVKEAVGANAVVIVAY
jgi:hypothetical protein